MKHPTWSRRFLRAGVAAAAGLGLLTGCSIGTDGPTATRTVTVAASPSTASTPSTSPSPAPTATPVPATSSSPPSAAGSGAARVGPNAPAGQCADSALQVSVQDDPRESGMSHRGLFVVFRDTGSAACVLEGAPGLSLVGGGDGTQIGPPATRTTRGARPVTIPPGGFALASVYATAIDEHGGPYGDGEGHDPACRAEAADGYRVYPPHSYRAFFSPSRTYACSTDLQWISVGPVRPASDFPSFAPAS